MLSGPFLSLVNLWNHMAAAAWLPWIVWAGDRALERPGLGRGLAWGALFSATILCGSPETGAMAAAVTAFLAVRRLPDWRSQPRQLVAAGACALLALCFAVALSAGQWLPSLDVARHSLRAQMPAETRQFWSVHPVNLLQIAFPIFVENLPLHGVWRTRWYESREPFLVSLYSGLPLGALAMAGLASLRARRWAWPVAALVALCVLVALGRHAPVYDVLVTLVPPLRALRLPGQGDDPGGLRRGAARGAGVRRLAGAAGPRSRMDAARAGHGPRSRRGAGQRCGGHGEGGGLGLGAHAGRATEPR